MNNQLPTVGRIVHAFVFRPGDQTYGPFAALVVQADYKRAQIELELHAGSLLSWMVPSTPVVVSDAPGIQPGNTDDPYIYWQWPQIH